jgi:hypothetical protein
VLLPQTQRNRRVTPLDPDYPEPRAGRVVRVLQKRRPAQHRLDNAVQLQLLRRWLLFLFYSCFLFAVDGKISCRRRRRRQRWWLLFRRRWRQRRPRCCVATPTSVAMAGLPLCRNSCVRCTIVCVRVVNHGGFQNVRRALTLSSSVLLLLCQMVMVIRIKILLLLRLPLRLPPNMMISQLLLFLAARTGSHYDTSSPPLDHPTRVEV